MSGWVSAAPYKQRILAYGDTGTGKSFAAVSISQKVGGKVYVVDTDAAWDVIGWKKFQDVTFGGKVETKVVDDWDSAIAGLEWAFGKAGRDDWVVIDSITDLHNFNMDWATRNVTGKDLADFYTDWLTKSSVGEIKKKGSQGFLIENGVYDLANPTWRGEVAKRIKVPKCHVYMTAHQAEAGTNPREDALTKQLYASFGYKPQGRKEVGFDAATVLLMGVDKVGNRDFSVVKDWGEQGGDRNVKYEDFAMEYLFKRNGWRPGKNG